MAGPIGSAPGIVVGVGVGAAAAAALEPAVEIPKQTAWKDNANRVLEPGVLARLVAQGGIDLAAARDAANRSGYSNDKLDALVYMAQTPPGEAELMFLWRLGYISQATWREGMVKLGKRPDWIDQMAKTFSVPLTAAEAAVAIHHNVIPNQGQLPGLDLNTTGRVLRFPQVPLNAYKSAEAYGFTNDQLDALTRTIGLPPGMDMVARMVFRGILDRGDFTLAALQSNRRTEWQEWEFEGYRQIPTAEQFVEAHLRGWITQAEMYAGTALHGMSQPNTDLEYQIHRRPLTPHAIKQALARGAKFNPEPGELTNPYEASVHQNSLGPEWYEMGISLAGSYPSVFITNRLVTSGIITPADGQSWLQKSGNADEVVTALHASWTGGATAKADTHTAKAQNQLWTRAHSSYVGEMIDAAAATTAIEAAGVAAAGVPAVLNLWNHERALIRKQLTPAQVKKAFKDGLYTRQQALDALLARGYDQADAATLLDE